MRCSSKPVPSVVTTNACVSPLVNSAEPCVLSRTPTSHSIGRTVFVSRPSILFPVFNNSLLTISFSMDFVASPTTIADNVSEICFSPISSLISLNNLDLFCFY